MTHSCPARVRLAMCDSCITLNTTPMQKYTMPTTPRNLAKLPSSVTLNMYSNVPNISRPKPTNIQVLMISILITHQHLEESLIAAKSVAHTEDGANRETISLTSECRSRNFGGSRARQRQSGRRTFRSEKSLKRICSAAREAASAIFIEAISTVFEKIPADLLSVCNWDLRFCTKASAAYISRSSVSSHSDKPLRYNVY
jgi:hypothetical protein